MQISRRDHERQSFCTTAKVSDCRGASVQRGHLAARLRCRNGKVAEAATEIEHLAEKVRQDHPLKRVERVVGLARLTLELLLEELDRLPCHARQSKLNV